MRVKLLTEGNNEEPLIWLELTTNQLQMRPATHSATSPLNLSDDHNQLTTKFLVLVSKLSLLIELSHPIIWLRAMLSHEIYL